MKLLVLAQTPPPVHGQSLMVQTLVTGLPDVGDFEIHHVNLALSSLASDIGRWRFGKLTAIWRACREARRLRRIHGPMTLYYVPAPGKRGALYRDWLVMLLCRRHFSGLILHWHACGLGTWLTHSATALERALTQRLLGRAALALVLAPELAADANFLAPLRTLSVSNGIPVPPPLPAQQPRATDAPCRLLFLGLCTASKGLLDLFDALSLALQRVPSGFVLTLAGSFAHNDEERQLRARAATLGSAVHFAGFADDSAKRRLFAATDVVCFPTHYPHEGQPLVLIEALAHDLPIVATRWRAIPGMLPPTHIWLTAPGDTPALADSLCAARLAPPPHGKLRQHFLKNFTRDHHLASLAHALTDSI